MADDWVLHVDSREQKCEKLCEELTSAGLNVKRDTLSVADYWFSKGGTVWCGIERKTLEDLKSSIIDGRYKDQTARMLDSTIPHLWFLVVGDLQSLDGRDRQQLESAMIHVQMHKNIKVRNVPHEGFVKPFLINMRRYLCEDPSVERITAPLVQHVQLSCAKRKLDSHEKVYIAQLMCVHGVSEAKAKAVAAIYPDLVSLLRAYGNCPKGSKMLKDVQCGKQKLGPVISARVYQCMVNPPDDESQPVKRSKIDDE